MSRQLIFVGDVQGCADELDALVARADATFGDACEMWIVGDLINRGPGCLRALRTVRSLCEAGRARFVLGNHEIGLLRVAFGIDTLSKHDSYGEVLEAPDADAWIEWLRARPLAESGVLGAQPFAMVHASVHPDWDLETLLQRARAVERRLQEDDSRCAAFLRKAPSEAVERDDLERLTHCRSVDEHAAWSSALPEGDDLEPWHRAWTRRGHAYGVVYGHWALQGLHVAPWLRGLDTGCVHHGRGRDGYLTAWLPAPEAQTPFDVPDGSFWQFRAKRAYYARRDTSN